MSNNSAIELRARLEAFVRQNWGSLASAGWRNYMRFGRGTILLSLDWLRAWEEGQLRFAVFPPYIVSGIEGLETVVAAYDPETSIVVAVTDDEAAVGEIQSPAESDDPISSVVQPGSLFAAWPFAWDPPPPAAHEQRAS